MKKLLFITCAVFLASAIVTANPSDGAAGKKLGIATYSVKGLESDIEGSFKALQSYGYTVMEISNYNASAGTVAGYKPADYAALAEKYGMDIISSHARASFSTKDVEGTVAAWVKVFDDHKAMGCKYVVFPMNMWSNTVDALKQECDLLNKIGEEANKRGIKFGYHNHSFEFATVPGTELTFEDFLITNTDPSKVFFQLDVYWSTVGGQDPVEFLKKYPDRIKVLHIKDDYVIGKSGSIDFKAVFTQFYKNGHEDWFVEMENEMTPEQKVQSVAMMDNMKKRMVEGGSGNPFGPPQGGARPQGQPQAGAQQPQGRQPQAGAQAGQPRQGAGQNPPAGFGGPRDPKVVAENLKKSLDGIKASAEYLAASDFVK